jgi:hypothetical protein
VAEISLESVTAGYSRAAVPSRWGRLRRRGQMPSPAARAAYFRERAREVGSGIEIPVEDEDCAHSDAAGAGMSELEVALRVAAFVILR